MCSGVFHRAKSRNKVISFNMDYFNPILLSPIFLALYQMLQKQLATVFLKLDEIKEEQQVQRRILSSIQKKVGDTAQVEDVELPHGCRFPLEAMDQLDRLEAMLSENSNLQKDLVRVCSANLFSQLYFVNSNFCSAKAQITGFNLFSIA